MSDQTSLENQYAYLHMQRALRPFRRARAFLVAVVLPPEADESHWKAAAKKALSEIVKDVEIEGDEYRDFRRVTRAANSVDIFEVEAKGKKIVQRLDPMAGLDFGDVRTVGLVRRHEFEELMTYPSMSIVDAVVDIETIDPAIVQRAAKTIFGSEISRQAAEDIIALPPKLRESIRRTGRPLSAVLARLRTARANAPEAKLAPLESDNGPYLEHLHGYGTAKTWGLELQRDLADFAAGKLAWDDVDRGLLLSGPPGTGKTTFARALANSCGVRLITGSYSSWQAHGHQGDMLRAMKCTFDSAREAAPAIVLIDEIDNFVDREKDGPHEEYMRGCVNGLLEQLDGTVELTGVVVIGACNHPGNVDPAIRRSGRLDRHIQLALPDVPARREILRYHLQSRIEVDAVLERTEGCSGADLERIARDARRIARRDRTAVSLAHVVAALPELKRRSVEEVRLIAVHELGHAVVSVAIGTEYVEKVCVSKFYEPGGNSVGGYTLYADENRTVRPRAYYADKLTGILGGLAAEEVIFGGHSDGVRHDLLTATRIAAFALGTVGMGGSLVSDGAIDANDLSATRLRSYDLDRRIDKLLYEMRGRAVDICRKYRDVIENLSCRLKDEGSLDGADIVAAVREFERCQPAQLALAFSA